MSRYPTLAVVDRQEELTVIWHVQTDPEGPMILSGAWLADAPSVPNLLAGTTELTVGSGAIERIHDAILADIDAQRQVAKAAKEAKPSLTLPRFATPDLPDVAALAEAFRGEEAARQAWATATAAAELVDAWHTLESQRRTRAYLAAEFGPDVRPLPLSTP